jgi:hypothetical protein
MEYHLHVTADAIAAHLSKGFRIERIDLNGARTPYPVGFVQTALDDSQCLWGTRSEYALLATPLDMPAAQDAGAILLIPYNDGGLISVSHDRGSVPLGNAKPADWFAATAEPFQKLCRPWL